MTDDISCIGYYCGRLTSNDSCGSCPYGSRADNTSLCQPCQESPQLYDWLYLGFMVVIPLGLNVTFTFRSYVLLTMGRKGYRASSMREWLLYLLSLVESVVAASCSLLLFEPYGSSKLFVCRVRSMADWYTVFYNPTRDFIEDTHCTQEAVYPLFSIVVVYYGLSIGATFLLRPIVFRHCYRRRHRRLLYYSLYIYPILIFIHFTCAGLIYYSFSYITLVGSLVLATYYYSKRFAMDEVDSLAQLLRETVRRPRHSAVVVVFWAMHLYGVVAITQLREPRLWIPLLLIVPLPYFFYILSFPFTKPGNLYLY